MQVIVLDRYEQVRAVLGGGPSACPVVEDKHVEKLENAVVTYEFAVPEDHPDAVYITPENYVIIRDLDGNLLLFRIKIVEGGFSQDGLRVKRASCENAALELNGSVIRPTTWTGVTASQALSNALMGTRWQPGVVEWLGSRTIKIDTHKSVTEVLHQIASEFGAELRWRVEWRDGRVSARYVDLLQRRGQVTGKRFEYAKDLVGVQRTEDTTALVTALIGLGKADDQGNRLTFKDVTWSKASGDPADKAAGLDWIGDEEALQRWGLPDGRHIMGVFEDPDEEDPEELLKKTWQALQERVNSRFTYKVDVALLERVAGLEHEAVRLGDTITVHDYTIDPPTILEARVIEIQRSYVDPSQDAVVLGYYRPLLTAQQREVLYLQRRLYQRQGVWDGKASVYKGPTPPENPADGDLWVDTSIEPNVIYRYDAAESRWVKTAPTTPAEIGAETAIAKGPTPPPNPTVGQLWIDTSSTPHALRQWNGSTWVKSTPTTAADIGAETPSGAQAKATAAENNAKSYADTKATTAENNAKSYADTKATTAENNAKSYADTKAATAESNAKSYADTKAAAAESNAKAHADAVAAQAEQNAKDAVANGEVPVPTSALQGFIDAAVTMIKALQGYVYIDGNGLVVYDKPVEQSPTKAVKIGSGGILVADGKDANGNWIWRTAITGTGISASEIRTGTMLLDRLLGGTAKLGGSGNGNGQLIVYDAAGVEKARLDNQGVTVTDANFLLKESRSGVVSSIVAVTNLVNDHSFEMLPRTGSADANQTFQVNETYLGNMYWWHALPGSSPVAPRVLSTYDTDMPQLALFDFQAAVVRHYSRYAWRQYVPVDQAAALLGPYTGSAFFAAFTGTTANTTAYMEMWAVDATLSRLALLGTASVAINASEKWKWKRAYKTFSNLPQGTSYVELFIYCNPDVPILVDGVQFVAAPYPVVYDPESALWRHARNIAGYTNVEALYVPPSIRIARTSVLSTTSGVSVAIPWQGRFAGYNSTGMWDPGQPDTSQIFIPESGKYLIICTVRWAANGNGYRLLAIKLNGGDNISKKQEVPVAGNPMYQQVSAMAHLNAGDYIQIVALQNSGTTLNLETETNTAPVLQMIKLPG